MFWQSIFRKHLCQVTLLSAVVLSGCGGTKLLKEPLPVPVAQALAVASDQRITARLEWVIVRDGPGTWAKNADWDEYLIRVGNLSDQPIQVVGVVVVDSLGARIESQPGRKQLVKASSETARRYKDSGIVVMAGLGAGEMLGAGALATGIGIAGSGTAAVATLELLATGGAVGGGTVLVVGGLLVLGPALAVGGIVRSVNNNAVDDRIELRQTKFPLVVGADEEFLLDVFFPFAPSPSVVEIMYSDGDGEHRLVIETRSALNGLHMGAPDDLPNETSTDLSQHTSSGKVGQ